MQPPNLRNIQHIASLILAIAMRLRLKQAPYCSSYIDVVAAAAVGVAVTVTITIAVKAVVVAIIADAVVVVGVVVAVAALEEIAAVVVVVVVVSRFMRYRTQHSVLCACEYD